MSSARQGRRSRAPAQGRPPRRQRRPPRPQAVDPSLRRSAVSVLTPGVGSTNARPFGHSRLRKKYWAINPRRRTVNPGFWDAFHPAHLPLPRPVAPYTVMRTTKLVTSYSRFNQFQPFRMSISGAAGNIDPCWSSCVHIGSNRANFSVGDSNNAIINFAPRPFAEGEGPIQGGGTCTPSAFSVQLVNSNSLNGADGVMLAAVAPTQMNLGGDNRSWISMEEYATSYYKPRLLAGAKLALRGVQMDSYPLSMTQVSEFTSMADGYNGLNPPISGPTGEVTWRGPSAEIGKPEDTLTAVGWAPIVAINTNVPEGLYAKDLALATDNEKYKLTFMITTEWRVRFDLGNPAVGGHTSHPLATDECWKRHIDYAISKGHGVLDIVERVAAMGEKIAPVVHAASALM